MIAGFSRLKQISINFFPAKYLHDNFLPQKNSGFQIFQDKQTLVLLITESFP